MNETVPLVIHQVIRSCSECILLQPAPLCFSGRLTAPAIPALHSEPGPVPLPTLPTEAADRELGIPQSVPPPTASWGPRLAQGKGLAPRPWGARGHAGHVDRGSLTCG